MFIGINQSNLGYASEIQETSIILGFERKVPEQSDDDFLPPSDPQIIPEISSSNNQQTKMPQLHARTSLLFFIGCLLSIFILSFWFLRAIAVSKKEGYF
ncbi:hypothetical protein D920_00077 [Enterococcus faecalis 13-SD-W-01]|nr:hypothetical protein D920_00077 [Enterococcus faecalis 13-SD-W-01]